ncbi:Pin2-interacting protein X1 [Fusarium verticillioides 7600]|uniref:PinX1-related protein 1 n=1 Tax=Gibberella moniliformis (strain M3125 / FGSC 7600) TaxID=334819 RepID=W7LGQ3_GIBM7|nr:Pin2-interacting protein X1 [Fusarium verticillioides 7600]EWG37726.1 Pin2-interacting protein X1 [Fusarium verticillioides 7600]
MGLLAENKTRRKINKDPNNTKWTKDTNTFGQKILRAQGWQPGQFLGAQDAPHSELHTAANASYIRVVLKDDMKGLGFSKSKEDEVTGLDVFQDLLSRLNGKTDDAIEEDQQARLAVKTHHFVEQRYGAMKFVYGGLLVGDEMKEVEEKKADQQAESNSDEDVVMEPAPALKESKKEKKSKKRKATDDNDAGETSSRETDSKSKKRRKEEQKGMETDSDDARAKKKKEKKYKKEKSRKKPAEDISDDENVEERSKKRKSKSKDKSSDEEKVKEKKSKKDKKDKKMRKKEEQASESTSTSVTQNSTPTASVPGTGATTPSGTSTPRGSRNFVRSRFIAQKRQAVLDTKALNQVCTPLFATTWLRSSPCTDFHGQSIEYEDVNRLWIRT